RAARVLVWCGVGRAILEVRRVEDCDVGPVAFPDQPAVAQPQCLSRGTRHLAYRMLEPQQVLFMHVVADDPREGPVKPWMRHPLAGDAVVGDAVAVGADQ